MSWLLLRRSDKKSYVCNQLATWWPWTREKCFFEFHAFSWSAADSAHFTAEPKSHPAVSFFEFFLISPFSTMYRVRHMWNSASPFSVYVKNHSFFIILANRSKKLLKRIVFCQRTCFIWPVMSLRLLILFIYQPKVGTFQYSSKFFGRKLFFLAIFYSY